ncbi:MAG: HAMP domain-containing protein [Bacillales bacterium]|nr:HAMP domain-containing protein [Bacillales bacterium]
MSLNKKLDLAFVGVLLSFALMIMLFNTLFLEKFYVYQKRNTLYSAYDQISEYVVTNGTSTADFDFQMLDIAQEYNIRISVFDADGYSVLSYNEFPTLEAVHLIVSENNESVLLSNAQEYDLYISEDGQNVDFTDDSSSESDDTEEVKELAIVGKITSSSGEVLGYTFIYTTYTSIKENTKIFNAYILYTSVVLLAISLIIVYFLSNQLTKPIKEVEAKAKRMANLDFSRKIEVNTHDEIGALAISINKLSDELEKNIDKLKKANVALQQDLKLKERINDMREEFISNVSHELKTPISIIGGYSEALKLSDLSKEDLEEYADIIIDETVKMNKLVRDLLKYTQIESGFVPLETDDFQITDIINSVIKPNDLSLKEKEINLSVEVEDIMVNGDYDMLETVFQNIFTNAINHADNERIIEVKSERTKDGKLRISVYNTGEKISKENQTRIFESFYKVDKARTRAYGGTGLGLAIVKSIMETYQNSYGVKNTKDGVLFFFDLNISKNTDNQA